jgi:hypothetical protein
MRPGVGGKVLPSAIKIIPNDAKLHYLLAQADFAGQMKGGNTQIDAALELPDRPD